MAEQRKFLPGVGDLIDRLTITQLKELLIPEHRQEYAKEIQDILHDIDINIKESKISLDSKLIRAIIILTIMNREIWLNEANCRNGTKEGCDLVKSHSLNGIRCTARNIIQEKSGGRKDYKIDTIEAYPEWVPSWEGK